MRDFFGQEYIWAHCCIFENSSITRKVENRSPTLYWYDVLYLCRNAVKSKLIQTNMTDQKKSNVSEMDLLDGIRKFIIYSQMYWKLILKDMLLSIFNDTEQQAAEKTSIKQYVCLLPETTCLYSNNNFVLFYIRQLCCVLRLNNLFLLDIVF